MCGRTSETINKGLDLRVSLLEEPLEPFEGRNKRNNNPIGCCCCCFGGKVG